MHRKMCGLIMDEIALIFIMTYNKDRNQCNSVKVCLPSAETVLYTLLVSRYTSWDITEQGTHGLYIPIIC